MTAYLLVENKGREMASRLLIAKALVERGIQVAVGDRKTMVLGLRGRPSGVVMDKGLNRIVGNAMRASPEHRHVPIDEEAFGIARFAQAAREHDHEAPAAEVYVNGHLDEYDETFSAVLTGNPRADLCGMSHLWMSEARRIRKAWGSFILVNTSSGGINSNWGTLDEYLTILHKIGWDVRRPDIAEHLLDDAASMQSLATFVRLAVDRGHRVIVRPHPSERADTWRLMMGDCADVVTEGWHIPWIAAASVLVHTGCTTGYEAALMGRPAVAMKTSRPVDHAFTSSGINPTDSPRAALNMVENILAGAPYESLSPGLCDAHARIAERLTALDTGPTDIAPFPSVERNDYERAKMTSTLEETEALYRRMGGTSTVRQVGDSVFVAEPV